MEARSEEVVELEDPVLVKAKSLADADLIHVSIHSSEKQWS